MFKDVYSQKRNTIISLKLEINKESKLFYKFCEHIVNKMICLVKSAYKIIKKMVKIPKGVVLKMLATFTWCYKKNTKY